MSRPASAALAALVLSACGGPTSALVAPRVAPSPDEAAPEPDAPAPVAEPVAEYVTVVGPWSSDLVGGSASSAAGLSIDEESVRMLVTSIDVDPVLLTRPRIGTAGWARTTLIAGSAVGGGLARDTALVVTMDPFAMTIDLRLVQGSLTEVIASDCPAVNAMMCELLAPDVLTYVCGGDRVVARREASGWTTLATLPDVLCDGAVADDGTVYLLDTNLMSPVTFWVVGPDGVTESTVEGVGSVGDVAACGGRLYATFELPYDRHSQPALGTWTGRGWQLETITEEVAGSGVLTLDEACHPFVGIGSDVYSRGRDGWVASSPDTRGGLIHDLAARGERIYATYDAITDSSHAGVAWAALAPAI